MCSFLAYYKVNDDANTIECFGNENIFILLLYSVSMVLSRFWVFGRFFCLEIFDISIFLGVLPHFFAIKPIQNLTSPNSKWEFSYFKLIGVLSLRRYSVEPYKCMEGRVTNCYF